MGGTTSKFPRFGRKGESLRGGTKRKIGQVGEPHIPKPRAAQQEARSWREPAKDVLESLGITASQIDDIFTDYHNYRHRHPHDIAVDSLIDAVPELNSIEDQTKLRRRLVQAAWPTTHKTASKVLKLEGLTDTQVEAALEMYRQLQSKKPHRPREEVIAKVAEAVYNVVFPNSKRGDERHLVYLLGDAQWPGDENSKDALYPNHGASTSYPIGPTRSTTGAHRGGGGGGS